MNISTNDPDVMKIGEAAQILGVTRRTVYRWIWGGKLPASKVGGLHFIQRADLQALLDQGRISASDSGENPSMETDILKCGVCFRLIQSDAQVGGACEQSECDIVICTLCWSQGLHFCGQHQPNLNQKWNEAQKRFQEGKFPLLLKSNTARLREVNFTSRIQIRLMRINTLIHPLSGEVLKIDRWENILEQSDERAQLMQLLGKYVLDSETTDQMPLNISLRGLLPMQKGQKGKPVEIQVKVLSRLSEMSHDGFDTQPLSETELTAHLLPLAEYAQRNQTILILVLAATTGWDASARKIMSGEASGSAFVHHWLLPYLYDLESGELLYHRGDDRLRGYAELFAPLLPSEEIEEVCKEAQNLMLVYDSLTLEYASETLPYARETLQKAFERMAETGKYDLIKDAQNGLAIIRK
ncbi:MAG: helix-turn-helix domain-containing protein [Chloroflexota bacterium]